MSLVALDGMPLIQVGCPNVYGVPGLGAATTTVMDAVNEAAIMVGRIYTTDGGSHTMDATGSSSLGWRTGNVTFANVGTSVTVGLAAVDTAAGPPARAVNSSDVITFDVSISMVGGGGGITANAWQNHVPTLGTKTIANGDLIAFCVQMTARGGVDSVTLVSAASALSTASRPAVTNYVAAAYGNSSRPPNALLTFSDGVKGWFWGGYVASSPTTSQTWNNTSGIKEYGNLLQFPFPVKVYGACAAAALTGDVDAVLYSDPLGTPVSEKSASLDANAIGTASSGPFFELFASPYTIPANTPVAIVLKPTSATNISMGYLILNAAADQICWNNGANGYAINRNTGAFAAQNSGKDRYAIGLLVGAFEHGVQPTYALGI